MEELGEMGGEGVVEGGEKKEVSWGAEPGVRGFEEDRREMDGSEECGVSILWREESKRVSDPLQGRDRLSICQHALINMTKGSNPTTRSVRRNVRTVCVPMFPVRCVCQRSSVLVTPDLRFTSKLYRGVSQVPLP